MGHERKGTQVDEWICEANCAYRTKALSRYGGFPENLGRKGDLLLSGENTSTNICGRRLSILFQSHGACSTLHPQGENDPEVVQAALSLARRDGRDLRLLRSLARSHAPLLGSLQLPACADDWRLLIEDNLSAPEFRHACAMLSSIGYLSR